MNRLQKKCFFAATGFHLLLVVILFVGPAFLSSNQKSDDRALIDFVPLKTIDEALSGGGSPTARPPAPAPPPPASRPQPPAPRPEEPVVQPPEAPKPALRDPDTFDTIPAKKLPDVSLKPVVRPKNRTTAKQRSTTTSDSQSDAPDERQAQFAKAARNAARSLQDGLSSGTSIEMPGRGGGGVPYANFLDCIKKRYNDAWIVPDGITDDEARVMVSVTIGRDGTVLDSRIIRPSGNALADQSVEMVLRRLTSVCPLPDNAKEDKRTVPITFSVKAKRGLG
jgi:TonB family protein